MRKAILFGGTGLVGSYLLNELLNNDHYSEVIAVTRRPISIQHPKLKTVIGDYASLSQLKDHIYADDIFIALGTTQRATPDRAKYYEVDHDYPLLAASIAKDQGASSVFLVSSIGANPDSRTFYLKTKGELERGIVALNFEHTHIFRPSMILGNRSEHRPGESIMKKVWKLIDPLFIGKLSKYKGIEGKSIAVAMVNSALKDSDKVKIHYWSEMHALQ